MFEFGARWGSRLAFLPIICDKSGFDLLSGPLTDINAANANEKDSIQEFLENLGRLLDIPMEPLSSFSSDIDKFEKYIKNDISQQKKCSVKDISGIFAH